MQVRSAAFSQGKGLGRSLLIKRGNLGSVAKGITTFLAEDEGLEEHESEWILNESEARILLRFASLHNKLRVNSVALSLSFVS